MDSIGILSGVEQSVRYYAHTGQDVQTSVNFKFSQRREVDIIAVSFFGITIGTCCLEIQLVSTKIQKAIARVLVFCGDAAYQTSAYHNVLGADIPIEKIEEFSEQKAHKYAMIFI